MSEQLTNSLGSVYLTIEYNEKQNWTQCTWRGFIRLPEIQEGFNAIIDFLEDKVCFALFSDHSGIVGPWNEGNEWLFSDWQPRALQKGLRYWAINTGDDLFSNISLELFLTKEKSEEYMIKVFEDNQNAQDWLKEKMSNDPLEARKHLKKQGKESLPPKKQDESKRKPAAQTEKKPATSEQQKPAAKTEKKTKPSRQQKSGDKPKDKQKPSGKNKPKNANKKPNTKK